MKVETRVLLVEDNAPLRRSLEKYLLQAGHAFDSCSTAREALVLAERHHHEIVIAEYHLPDANGCALLERLTRLAPNVATIVISEYEFHSVAEDLVRANVYAFLKKPFDLVELETALSSACSRARILLKNVKMERASGLRLCLPSFSRESLSKVQS